MRGARGRARSLVLYFHADYGRLLLVLLILAPDLSMLGHLGGTTVGAVGYDAVHTTLIPITLSLVGVLAGSGIAIQIALIWLAHIGMDRFLGYGLKYPTGVKRTHLPARVIATRRR